MNQITAIRREQTRSVLENVKRVTPEIRARADEIERHARVPLDLLEKVEATGAFRMCLPASVGGLELPYSEVSQVVEEIASADASVAWHCMVAAGTQIILARLPLATQLKLYASGPDTSPKCAVAPKGVATPVEGGYRLSGRWPLASGAREFEWVSVGFFIKDADGVRKGPNGMPQLRMALLPKADATVIPTWDAVGLRGTRSDDIEIKDIFVPEAWQAPMMGPSLLEGPTVRLSIPWAAAPHHSAVVTGILKAAIRHLVNASLTRKPAFNPTLLMKDDPVFRTRFGEIAARVDALCALAEQTVEVLDCCNEERRVVGVMEGARITAAEALIHHEGTSLMDQIMALSGAEGVYSDNPQQRRWRDLRCVAQHQAANIGSYNTYSNVLIAEALEHQQPAELETARAI